MSLFSFKNIVQILAFSAFLSCGFAFCAEARPLVFVLAGQSNAAGCAPASELFPEQLVLPHGVRYWIRDAEQYSFGAGGQFGPEIGFLATLKPSFPNREIWLIKWAVGGSSSFLWRDELLAQMMADLRIVIGGREVDFGGVIWVHGEMDSMTPHMAQSYRGTLTGLRKRLAALTGEIPWVLPLVSYESISTATVQDHQIRLATAKSGGFFLVPSIGLQKMADAVHYSAAGQLDLGRRLALKWLSTRPTTNTHAKRKHHGR